MNQQNKKQRINKPSILLSQDENDLVFTLLGRRCQTMSTAVVQLFTTEAPAHSAWIKRLSGIACFVGDSKRRSYFIRVYCMVKHELVWEEEMHDSTVVGKPREFLINFEGQDCLVALSFSSDAEANMFHKAVTATIANRLRSYRSRKFSPTKTDGGQDTGHDSGVVLRNQNSKEMSQILQTSQPTTGIQDKKRPNRKLKTTDISQPTNFQHVAHVGWNDSNRVDLDIDEVYNSDVFLREAGVSQQQLKNRDTPAHTYNFIQSHNVLDSVKSEKQQQAPPPDPTRNKPTQRITPPPPPSANGSHSALIDSIIKGTKIRTVDEAPLSTGSGSGDARSGLLSEIRRGVELKPAPDRELSNRGTDALLDKWRKVITERYKAMAASSSSDNESWDD